MRQPARLWTAFSALISPNTSYSISRSSSGTTRAFLSNNNMGHESKKRKTISTKLPITVYHIPICPFSQRLEILCELKKLGKEEVRYRVVDITKPRAPHILELSGGTTALPVMEVDEGMGLKESLVLMNYLEDSFDDSPIFFHSLYYNHALQQLTDKKPLIRLEEDYSAVLVAFSDDATSSAPKTFIWSRLLPTGITVKRELSLSSFTPIVISCISPDLT